MHDFPQHLLHVHVVSALGIFRPTFSAEKGNQAIPQQSSPETWHSVLGWSADHQQRLDAVRQALAVQPINGIALESSAFEPPRGAVVSGGSVRL